MLGNWHYYIYSLIRASKDLSIQHIRQILDTFVFKHDILTSIAALLTVESSYPIISFVYLSSPAPPLANWTLYLTYLYSYSTKYIQQVEKSNSQDETLYKTTCVK